MPQVPPMGNDPMAGGAPDVGMPPMDDMGADPMGGADDSQMPPADGEEQNQFDSNFDAGVEADEDEDPKHFIQQLTGKLSQSFNKYSKETPDDEETAKYVGKMVIKAVAKALDEKGKKDLIKTINTTESEEDEEMPNDDGMGDDSMEMDMPQGEEPMNECVFKKSEIKKLSEELNQHLSSNVDEPEEKAIQQKDTKIKKKTPFDPKVFNK